MAICSSGLAGVERLLGAGAGEFRPQRRMSGERNIRASTQPAACRSGSRRPMPRRSSSTSGAAPKSTWQKQPDGFWTVTTDAAGSRLSLLHADHRRRGRQRPQQPGVLRRQQLRERRRGSRAGLDLLLDPERAARTGARGLVPLESHGQLAARAGLSAARLRCAAEEALSRCSICSTAAARTRPAGSARAAPISSSTT